MTGLLTRGPQVVFAAWLATRAVFLLPVLATASADLNHGDMGLYRGWAAEVLEGDPPGLSKPWQYPLGALLPVTLPGLVTTGVHYPKVFIALQVLVDLALLVLLLRRGRRLGSGTAGAWMWVVAGGIMAPLAYTRLDLASVLPALAAFCVGPVAGGVLIAVAVGMKAWPVMLLPGVLLLHGRGGVWRVTAGFAVPLAVVGTVLAVTGRLSDALAFARFQQTREVEIEAVGALGVMWSRVGTGGGSLDFWDPVAGVYVAPGAGGPARVVLLVSLVVAAAAVLLGVAAARRDRRRAVGLACTAVVCAALIGDSVLSPQYLLWLAVPVIWSASNPGRGHHDVQLLALAAMFLTANGYVLGWVALLEGKLAPLIVLTIRDAVLVLCAAACLRHLVRQARAPAGPEASEDPQLVRR